MYAALRCGSMRRRSRILHRFSAEAGRPVAPLLQGSDGTLYGTTQRGGVHGKGTVFKAVSQPDGTLAVTVLHTFTGLDS